MSNSYFLSYDNLQSLIDLLNKEYRAIGPTKGDGAIVYTDMNSIDQLPWGLRDIQDPGSYKLEQTNTKEAFAFALGPQAIKPELFKPRELLWKVKRDDNGKLAFEQVVEQEKLAFIGIRPCDLHALQIQDKVFLESDYEDIRYKERREQVFLVVVNCSYSTKNCFCLSAGGSPEAKAGYDIALTEVDGGFVAQFSSGKAQDFLSNLNLETANDSQIKQAQNKIQNAIDGQTKTLPEINIEQLLKDNINHPQWEDVAKRCLACGNCTQSCPTCFCHKEKDEADLNREDSSHIREWDSCFSKGHSYIHGMVIRPHTKERYRQWLTHKFSTWHDQFGSSGCVGCGRCVTWCPVGIDVTDEIKTISENPHESK